jgi:hypothetical protein
MIMAVSGLGIIALLVHKHLELTKGMQTRVQGVREKTDPILKDIRYTTSKAVSHVTLHNIILVLNHAFVHVVRFFMNISHRAHKASADLVEKASKKTEDLSKAGAASFYLKQIKESKEGLQSRDQSTTETERE